MGKRTDSAKKFISSLLCANMFLINSPEVEAVSEISGVTANANVYDIEALKYSGSTGFRSYEKFNLGQGDAANMIFRNGQEHFVNLVSSQVNINGILNSMQNGNFYNGHVVFVAPGGIMAGSTGVLNVGSLTLTAPNQSSFNKFLNAYNEGSLDSYNLGAKKHEGFDSVLKDMQGNIIINGRIVSRGDINLYGKDVTIKGSAAVPSQVIAGIGKDNYTEKLNYNSDADYLFNKLVSNNIGAAGKGFTLKDGKIVITANADSSQANGGVLSSKVDIQNAALAGSDVNILAKTETKHIVDITKLGDTIDSGLRGTADEAKADVQLNNVNIFANNVDIQANAATKTVNNINLITPALMRLGFDSDSKWSEFFGFSSDIYNGFDGARSSAAINAVNTHVKTEFTDETKKTGGNVNFISNASSTLDINSEVISQAVPALLYGFGSKTVSKVDLKDSDINAKGNVNLDAFSNISNTVKMSDSSLFTMRAADFLDAAYLNNSIYTDTQVTVDNSKINANNVEAKAISFNVNDTSAAESANLGKNSLAGSGQGGSAFAFSFITNHFKTNTKVNIKNNSVINSENDVRLLAQSLNSNTNAASTKINSAKTEADTKEPDGKFNQFLESMKTKVPGFMNTSISGMLTGVNELKDHLDTANFKFGGAGLFNYAENINEVNVDSSSITAQNITLQANTVDVVSNSAASTSEPQAAATDAKFGAGISLVRNYEENKTKANINKSVITAAKTLNVDAAAQIPMNPMDINLTIIKMPFISNWKLQIGANFDTNEDDKLTISPNGPSFGVPKFNMGSSTGEQLAIWPPSAARTGLFNNLASSAGQGNNVGIAGSLVFSTVVNNTEASITNSDNITVNGSKNAVNINAVNSVVGYNGAGQVDFILDMINNKIKGKDAYSSKISGDDFGVGASILVNNYTNNAAAKVEKSTIKAANGNVNVNSANEEAYLSVLITGGGGGEKSISNSGSITWQTIGGKSESYISSSKIEADNVDVISGKGKINAKPKGKLAQDEKTKEMKLAQVEVKDENGNVKKDKDGNVITENKPKREAKDRFTNVKLIGSLDWETAKVSDAAQTSTNGTAIGESINFSTINRTLNSYITGSDLNLKNNLNVLSQTYSTTVQILLSAAFSGGAALKDQNQDWMSAVNNARDEDDVLGLGALFDENNANAQGANAAGAGGNLAGGNALNPLAAEQDVSNALAGALSVVNDNTIVKSYIESSDIQAGKELNVKSNNEVVFVDINGGFGDASRLGAGAAVNLYKNNSFVSSVIGNNSENAKTAKITFSDNNTNKLNVLSDNDLKLINLSIGYGGAKGDNNSRRAAIGGSFNWNTLKNTTQSAIYNALIANTNSEINKLDITVKAKDVLHEYNTAGAASYESGGQSTNINIGASVNRNLLKKTVKSEIKNSEIKNANNIGVNANLDDTVIDVQAAGNVVTTEDTGSSYSFDGAGGIELIENTVSALVKDTKASAKGDVNIKANSEFQNMSLSGAVEFANSGSGLGAGLGSVVSVNNSLISAAADKFILNSSKSLNIEANSKEDLKFLAANLGMQTDKVNDAGKSKINLNGIINVSKINVNASAINGSELNSDGNINIAAKNTNDNQGITAAGDKAGNGKAIAGNVLFNSYVDTITAKLDETSKINAKTTGNVNVNAVSIDKLNFIPAGIAIAANTSGLIGGAAANVSVDILKNTINSQVYGDVQGASLLVNAQQDTTLYNRGGVAALTAGDGSKTYSGAINVDYFAQKVNAEIKNNTVEAAGNVIVNAADEISMGGTKKEDGTYEVVDLTNADNFKTENLEQNSNFKNWNMFYDLSRGDSFEASGALIFKTIKDEVNAIVNNSKIKSNNLTVQASDYAIVNAISGRIAISGGSSTGANILRFVSDSITNAFITNASVIEANGDVKVKADTSRVENLILVSGSTASGSLNFNGASGLFSSNDKTNAIVDKGSNINKSKSIEVNAKDKNSIFSVDLSAANSSNFSVGGILYNTDITGNTKALIGDNSGKSNINSTGNILVSANEDNAFRTYILNVGNGGQLGLQGFLVKNNVNSNVSSQIINTNVFSENGKVDVLAAKGWNKGQSDKTNFVRNWFKDTSAYKSAKKDKYEKGENNGVTANEIGKLAPIAGALNVSSSQGALAVSATAVYNTVKGSVTAQVIDSVVSSEQGLNINAQRDYVNFDGAAAIAAAASNTFELGGLGIINKIEDIILSELKSSEVKKGGANLNSLSNIDINQLILQGSMSAGGGVSISGLLDSNTVKDKVHSYITGSKVTGDTSLNAVHNLELNNILLQGGYVSTGINLGVVPLVNTNNSEAIAAIRDITNNDKTLKSEIKDGVISINANDYIDNLSAIAGLNTAGEGGAVSVFVIDNDYNSTVKSYIDNAIIDAENKDINISSNVLINSTNAMLSIGIAPTGAAALWNHDINGVVYTSESYIKNSLIKNAGNISVISGKDKNDKQDEIYNIAANVSFSAAGAAGSVNRIYNIFKNTTKACIEDTKIEHAKSLDVETYGNRAIDSYNTGVSAGLAGVGAQIDLITNQIDPAVYSYIQVKDDMNLDNAVNVKAVEQSANVNYLAAISGSAEGVGASVIYNANYSDSLIKSEILQSTNSKGRLKAGSINVLADSQFALRTETLNISLGILGAGAGADYQYLRLGERNSTQFTEADTKNKLASTTQTIKNDYDNLTQNSNQKGRYTPDSNTNNPQNETYKTGTIARVKANVETTWSGINIEAKNALKGLDIDGNLTDNLKMRNVSVSGGLGAIGAAVKSLSLSNNIVSEIANGNILAKGDVNVKSSSSNNVEVVSANVDIGGLTISGSSAKYDNAAKTMSHIADSTVNSEGNINVDTVSSNKGEVFTTAVVVSGGELAGIANAQAIDSNKAIAEISGSTNITSNGKLTVHSKGNSDVSAILRTAKAAGVSFASYISSKADAANEVKALINDVNGAITVKGLDIITDFDKMSAYNRANIVMISGANIYSGGSSGTNMNSVFESGIKNNSETNNKLKITNKGQTYIAAAKDNSNNGVNAESKINNVNISIAGGWVAASSAKSINNVKSNTYLQPYSHIADSLIIDSILKTTSKAIADSTSVTITVNVNAVDVAANTTSALSLAIAGNNDIKGSAAINALHNISNQTNLDAFSLGLITSVQNVEIKSDVKADTNLNLAGDFSYGQLKINSQTDRLSQLNLGAAGGGIVGVNNTKAANKLSGDNNLIIDGVKSLTDNRDNNTIITHKSNNTFDTVSKNNSGGLVAVSANNLTSEFNTQTKMALENSVINSKKDIKYKVENNSIVKDSSSMDSGGLIASNDNNITNTYTSKAYIDMVNSSLNGRNVELNTVSSVKNANESGVTYYGDIRGFFRSALDTVVRNTINHESKIALTNSSIFSLNDTDINTRTETNFKQTVDTSAKALVSKPHSYSYLTVNNDNLLSLDSNSSISSGHETEINFDSKSDLLSYAIAKANHLGFRDAVSHSDLTYTVNNTLNNSGKIQAGELVDINFMNGGSVKNASGERISADYSTNNLVQKAYSETNAVVVPTTTETGKLEKKINNKLEVASTGSIVSGRDVDINYSSGKGDNLSEIAYKLIINVLFNTTKTGKKSNSSINTASTLKLDGDIVAGKGGNRYMKINPDGTIDAETSGFLAGDYYLYEGTKYSAEELFERDKSQIKIDIDNLSDDTFELSFAITNLTNLINELNENISQIDTVKGYAENAEYITISELENKQLENLRNSITGSGSSRISETLFNKIYSEYKNKIENIDNENNQKIQTAINNGTNIEGLKDLPEIKDFLTENNSKYNLTNTQINHISKVYKAEENAFTTTDIKAGASVKGIDNYSYYKDPVSHKEYFVIENKSIDDSRDLSAYKLSVKNAVKDDLIEAKNLAENTKEKYIEDKSLKENIFEIYNAQIASLENKLNNLNIDDYENQADDSLLGENSAIIFNSLKSGQGKITLNGIDVNSISGTGNFRAVTPGLLIDNYSSRSLIFNGDIDLGSNSITSLKINGKDYAEFLDKNQAVSGLDVFYYKNNIPGAKSFANLPTSGIHYKSSLAEHSTNVKKAPKGVNINNYYDLSNPFIENPQLKEYTAFAGSIKSNGDIVVNSDSGDIYMYIPDAAAPYSYDKLQLNAYQGSVLIGNINPEASFTLKSDDSIFAGIGAYLYAKQFDIKGNITSGHVQRNLNITSDMLSHLKSDPVTGKENLIDLGENPYTNSTNNIKAIYDDGKVYLYRISDSGGDIVFAQGQYNPETADFDILAPAQGSIFGKIKSANGYQRIEINNPENTGADLVLSDIINSNSGIVILGNLEQKAGSVVENSSLAEAYTYINSDADLILNGSIKNGVKLTDVDGTKIYMPDTDANHTLEIRSTGQNSNLYINKPKNEAYSILSGGIVRLTNTGGDFDINGDILVNSSYQPGSGLLIIQDAVNSQFNINSNITQQNGILSILSNGDMTIGNNSVITNNIGDTRIFNTEGITDITGAVKNKNGNLSIEAAGYSLSTEILANIQVEQGNINIQNNSGSLNILGNIELNQDNDDKTNIISISGGINSGEINVDGNIINYGQGGNKDGFTSPVAIIINNESANYGTDIYGNIIAKQASDIVIHNTMDDLNLGTDITLDKPGSILISNDGKDTNISGDLTVKEGDISLGSSGTNGKLTVSSNISTDKGNIYYTNHSAKGFELTSTSSNTSKEGDIQIINTQGTMNVRGKLTTEKGKITITDNSTSDSVISANINSKYGDVKVSHTGNNLTLTETASIDVNKGIENDTITQNNITIENTGAKKTSLLGKITNWLKGNITIASNEETGAAEIKNITNTNGNIELTTGDLTVTENAQIINKNGNVNIQTNGISFDISDNALISNEGGNINIDILSGETDIKGAIKNKAGDVDGNINITNGGSAFTTYENSEIINENNTNQINQKKGNININQNSNDAILGGKISNTNGNINIKTNNSALSLELAETSDIYNTGRLYIYDYAGGNLVLGGKITNEKSDYPYSSNIEIFNYGGDFTYNAELNNSDGDVMINHNGGSTAQIKGSITNTNGSVSINNNGASSVIGANIVNNNGQISFGNNYNNNSSVDMKFTDEFKVSLNSENENHKITFKNDNQNGDYLIAGSINAQNNAGIDVINRGSSFIIDGIINIENNDINISNNAAIYPYTQDAGLLKISGDIENENGAINISNTSSNGLTIAQNSYIKAIGNEINISNQEGALTIEQGSIIGNIDKAVKIENAENADKLSIFGNLINGDGAISILNSSSFGMELNNNDIIAENGKITITNDKGNLDIGSYIQTESSDIKISNNNLSGNLTYTGQIISDNGNIQISNGQTSGDIVNDGKLNLLSGSIDTKSGNITINNYKEKFNIGSDIYSDFGEIEINNTRLGSDITISGKINSGSANNIIRITNETSSDLTIKSGAEIVNEKSNILITNNESSGNGNLTIEQGALVKLKDGILEILNLNRGDTVINGKIHADKGNILVENAADGKLEISGIIENYEGQAHNTPSLQRNESLTIKNRGNNGLIIKQCSQIVNYDSPMLIQNNNGDLTIENGASIVNLFTNSNLTIENTETAGILNIAGSIANGNGDLIIKNESTQYGTIFDNSAVITNNKKNINISNKTGILNSGASFTNLDGDISIVNNQGGSDISGSLFVKDGNLSILNNKENLSISAVLSNDKGNINITNNGTSGLILSGTAITKDGEIEIDNTKGTASILGSITNNKGNVTIQNTSDNGTTISDISTITLDNGNLTITNQNQGLNISGEIINKNGNTQISNLGTDTIISSNVTANEGALSIQNSNGKLDLSGVITDNKGGISITNLGENTTISNSVTAQDGSLSIANTQGTLSITGAVENNNSGLSIINTGGGTSIENTVLAKNGDLSISNSNGMLNILRNISNDKGNLSISNSGTNTIISGNVTANEGALSIQNSNGKLDLSGVITNNKGGISITNLGENTTISDVINAQKGALSILNAAGALNISSNISNDKGDLSISNSGTNTTISGNVTANEGALSIQNSNGKLDLSGIITDNKGGISITNLGENLAISNNVTAQDGSLSIFNKQGKLNILSEVSSNKGNLEITNEGNLGTVINGIISANNGNLKISNKENALSITKSVTNNNGSLVIENLGTSTTISDIINAQKGALSILNAACALNISSNISNDKGNLSISNSGTNTTISGNVTANEGALTIQNSNGKLDLSGVITDNKGGISITNLGENTTISNSVTAQDGSLSIFNKQGKLNILSEVSSNKGNLEITNEGSLGTVIDGIISANDGNLTISNKENALSITKSVTNNNGSLVIENLGENTTISDVINAQKGALSILNAAGALNISNNISNDKGNLSISNLGTDTIISGNVTANEGALSIQNSNGKLDLSGIITDNKGGISITNLGENTTISNSLTAQDGNLSIANTQGTLSITGAIENNNGGLSILNTGGGTSIENTVLAKNGDLTIFNALNSLNITNNITANKGNLEITNEGSLGTVIDGIISANDGNLKISNKENALSITKSVTNNNGSLVIENLGENTTISDVINAQKGALSILNAAGALNISSNISNDKGDLSISNSGTNTTISGNVTANEGALTIQNSNGKLDLSGVITDNKGGISITNLGENTTISNSVTAQDGSLSIANTQGTLSITGAVENNNGGLSIINNGNGTTIENTVLAKNGDLTIFNALNSLNITNNITADKGNLEITNEGENGLTAAGKIHTKDGNAEIKNTQGAVTITADIINNNGNLSIINTGDKGTDISSTILSDNGNLTIQNTNDGFNLTGNIINGIGNTAITNNGGKFTISNNSVIKSTQNGNILITNNGSDFDITGSILTEGKCSIKTENFGSGKFNLPLSGVINANDGNVEIANTSSAGFTIQGLIKSNEKDILISNSNTDLLIGEYASNNDNYITAEKGNVVINQINGSILNNVTDPDSTKEHISNDIAHPDHAYKTMIKAGGDLTMNVTDGDIGMTSNTAPGFSIDASTRDYTESLNINVSGGVSAKADNNENIDNRLINIRAKNSDLRLKNAAADGNVILTAADWKYPSQNPIPTDNEDYFKGYSILSAINDITSNVQGQNISIIASDTVGDNKRNIVYTQDTDINPNSSVSILAENDLHVTARGNSYEDIKVYQLISKRGELDFDMESNGAIQEINAGKGLSLTQKAQNLTIINLAISMPISPEIPPYEDMLKAHDGITSTGYDDKEAAPGKTLIPNYINIKVLDAIDTPQRSDSNLVIYSANILGNQGENTQYYEDGSRLADVTLMADNIYALSDKAPVSVIETAKRMNPDFKMTYSPADFGGTDTNVYNAQGINIIGDGAPMSLDLLGVDHDYINSVIANPNRNNYEVQNSVSTTPDKFKNNIDRIVFYDHDYRVKNAFVSVNDYNQTNRGVEIDTIYANNAYINTDDTNFSIEDGYITNYAEFRNNDKLALVTNNFNGIRKDSDIQLYTVKTGSFSLGLNNSINMITSAPVIYNNPEKLVNGYHSEYSFPKLGEKENKVMQNSSEYAIQQKFDENSLKNVSLNFNTLFDKGLKSDVFIYNISTTGALIRNDNNLKKGNITTIKLKFDDVDTMVKAKVVNIDGDKVNVEFVDLPKNIANKILYRYMLQENSDRMNFITSGNDL